MEKMIDVGAKYLTRDGSLARIYATDGMGKWPIHGAVFKGIGWVPVAWNERGFIYYDEEESIHEFDLVKEV